MRGIKDNEGAKGNKAINEKIHGKVIFDMQIITLFRGNFIKKVSHP